MTWHSSVTRQRRPPAAQAGFSLLETLVVLTILSLAAAIAAPALFDRTGARAVTRSASEAAALLRRARAEAALSGSDAVVEVDLKAKSLSATWTDRKLLLPDDMRIEAITAQEEVVVADRAPFRFFADGGATGGELRFSLKRAEARVGVDWLTGRISRASTPP